VVDPSELSIAEGGYVTRGDWHGYAWTMAITGSYPGAVVSTITPATFATLTTLDHQLCAQGVVGKSGDYGGVGMVGINLHQAMSVPPAGQPPTLLYTPTGTGIAFAVTNNGGSNLRIQLQDDSGTAAGRWCSSISGEATGTLTWADFNTTCWSPATGSAYNKQPLRDISVLVPGNDVADIAFDFCITVLSEVP